jgi:hypothetical protein
MRRIRWLGAKLPGFLTTIGSKMKANPFTQESYDGFIVERVRDTFIEARYIQKLSYQETITDPFGNNEVFDRVEYRQVAFNLFADFPNIELLDAPRSIHSYISKLLELSNFSLSVNYLQVNLLDWVKLFQGQLEKTIVINSIQIAGLEVEQGISAKVLLRGDRDVRIALGQFAKDRQYILEKLQLKVQFDRDIVPIHLTNNGTAKIPEDFLDDFLPMLRISLPHSVRLE